MTWYADLFGAAGDNQNSGGNNTGIIGNTLGISAGLDARDRRRNERAQNEFRRLLSDESVFNFEQGKRATERAQDLAPQLTGNLNTEYLTPDMLMTTNRDQLGGGALETILNMAGGYNPVMSADPYMQVMPGDKGAVEQLRRGAEANTEATLGGWEAAAAELADQYTQASDAQIAQRDEMRDTYTSRLEADRFAEDNQMAQTIVESWIDSNDSSGAAGNEDFIDRRGQSKGAKTAGMILGFGARRRGHGKVKGANEDAKREFINDMLSSGKSYVDILNDPEMRKYFTSDDNTTDLFSTWRADQGY